MKIEGHHEIIAQDTTKTLLIVLIVKHNNAKNFLPFGTFKNEIRIRNSSKTVLRLCPTHAYIMDVPSHALIHGECVGWVGWDGFASCQCCEFDRSNDSDRC